MSCSRCNDSYNARSVALLDTTFDESLDDEAAVVDDVENVEDVEFEVDVLDIDVEFKLLLASCAFNLRISSCSCVTVAPLVSSLTLALFCINLARCANFNVPWGMLK